MRLNDYDLGDPDHCDLMRDLGLEGSLRLMRKIADPKHAGGYVYIMRFWDTDIYKIGVSIHPHKRQEQIQSKSPLPIYLIKYWFGHDYLYAERCLHETFWEKRVAGEWFRLCAEDLAYVYKVMESGREVSNISNRRN